jgi:hypothetical protein
MSIYLLDRLVVAKQSSVRQQEISAIYDKLNLQEHGYRTVKSDIFGDKRPYEWDSSRSYSSSIEYGHNDTPANTRADLMERIEKAGFSHFETAYEGSIIQQDHYRNSKGQYVRVTITPKAWQDAILYGTPEAKELRNIDKNAGPSYVSVKVNLDDNNE